MEEPLKDLDPPIAPVVNTAGAVNTAAGVALLFLSKPIHIFIGLVLIGMGIYLFVYARRFTRAWEDGRRRYAECLDPGRGDGDGGEKRPRPDASAS